MTNKNNLNLMIQMRKNSEIKFKLTKTLAFK